MSRISINLGTTGIGVNHILGFHSCMIFNKCTCTYICLSLSTPTCFARLLLPSSWCTVQFKKHNEILCMVTILRTSVYRKKVIIFLSSWSNHDKIWMKWLYRKITPFYWLEVHSRTARLGTSSWLYLYHYNVSPEIRRRRRPKYVGVDHKKHI